MEFSTEQTSNTSDMSVCRLLTLSLLMSLIVSATISLKLSVAYFSSLWFNPEGDMICNYFCYRIQPEVERLLYDAEHDLLAIAKFIVTTHVRMIVKKGIHSISAKYDGYLHIADVCLYV